MMQRRQAFTLVELLVVIAIISMLAGLLIPGVQMAREAARRNTCINNQRNLAIAFTGKDGATKHLPGYMNVTYKNAAGNFYGSWVVQIAEYLENKPIATMWRDATFATNFGTSESLSLIPQLPILLCPSAGTVEEPGANNYVVNCGRPDNYGDGLVQWKISTPVNVTNPPPVIPPFPWTPKFELLGKELPARAAGVFAAGKGSCAMSDIKDGKSQTLLTSENSYAGKWFGNQVQVGGSGAAADDVPAGARPGANWEGAIGFCWSDQDGWSNNNTDKAIKSLNYSVDNLDESSRIDWALVTDYSKASMYASPASHHADIVVVSMCDASARPISIDIDWSVWVQLMTPNGQQYKEPAITGEY